MAWGWAVVAVAAGGAVGAVVRHALATARWGPLRGVLVANTVGAAALGALVASTDDPRLLLLVGTGLCGALTTWSTLAVQVVQAGSHGRGAAWATAYLVLSVVLGTGAALVVLRLLG